MSNNNNNPQNYQNMQMMPQQFAQQQRGDAQYNASISGMPGQQQLGTPQQQQKQQRNFQLQQQQMQQMHLQQQMHFQSNQGQQQGGNQFQNRANAPSSSPLSSQPSSLTRPNALAPASSTGSLARMASSSNVGNKGGKGAAAANASKAAGKPPSDSKQSSASATTPGQNSDSNEELTKQLLSRCDWKDKTIWVSRQLLGGNATNGFLRSTATVQRIKRQRARQTAQSKQKAVASATGTDKKKDDNKDKDDNKNKKKDAPDQAAEEELKKEVMNPRTAKKIKSELEIGLNFCVNLHNTIRSILFEMDPQVAPHTPLPLHQGGEVPTMKPIMPGNPKLHPAAVAQAISASQPKPNANAPLNRPTSDASLSAQRRGSEASVSKSSQASPGEPGGSTLRRNRKKKLPPSNEKPVALAEFDASGKRVFSRKEHTFRVFEAARFRPLKQGDFVAARVTSRDLWILARVQKDYPGFSMSPSEFLKLTEAKRDALFREKVHIKDVEDKAGGSNVVTRSLVLPLPRTFSEAAEWCQWCKKGSRVYAMYPHTTSLYSATVIDNTTYCRQDDDIIVVEFDGDEPDVTGALPNYHIPARFVTLIPREFAASQTNSKKRKSVTTTQAPLLPNANKSKRNSTTSTKSNENKNNISGQLMEEDPLGSMIGQMGFEDLVSANSLDDLEQFDFDFSEDK